MTPVTALALGRIGLGLVAFTNPRLAARGLRLDPDATPPLSYVTRLAGGRDVALGVATLLAPRGARKALLGIGMAVDAGDAFAGYDAWRTGALSATGAAVVTAPAVSAVLAGAVALRERAPGAPV